MPIEILQSQSTNIIVSINTNITIQTLDTVFCHGTSSVFAINTHTINFLRVNVLMLNSCKEVNPTPSTKGFQILPFSFKTVLKSLSSSTHPRNIPRNRTRNRRNVTEVKLTQTESTKNSSIAKITSRRRLKSLNRIRGYNESPSIRTIVIPHRELNHPVTGLICFKSIVIFITLISENLSLSGFRRIIISDTLSYIERSQILPSIYTRISCSCWNPFLINGIVERLTLTTCTIKNNAIKVMTRQRFIGDHFRRGKSTCSISYK